MTELTDRMRTCAAHLAAHTDTSTPYMRAVHDAASLLNEAADTLEAAGVGMVVMDTQTAIALDVIPARPPPQVARYSTPFTPLVDPNPGTIWYDDKPGSLPHQPSKNACPKCDSRTTKTVRATMGGLMLECPVCGHVWKR